MKVNINGVEFDSEDVIISIELSDIDKENITKMPECCNKYICYPKKDKK